MPATAAPENTAQKPEVKPDVKTDASSDVKLETKPEAKPETQEEHKPALKDKAPAAKPEPADVQVSETITEAPTVPKTATENREIPKTPVDRTETPEPARPVAEPHAAAPSQPVKDLSFRLTSDQQEKVEVKVVERAGEVRVAVRTGDSELANSLQQGLSELVANLENKGFRAEAWKPAQELHAMAKDAVSNAGNANQPQTGGEGEGQQQQHRQPQPEYVPPRPKKTSPPAWASEIDGAFSPFTFNPRSTE